MLAAAVAEQLDRRYERRHPARAEHLDLQQLVLQVRISAHRGQHFSLIVDAVSA
jgi:hypothetical protein